MKFRYKITKKEFENMLNHKKHHHKYIRDDGKIVSPKKYGTHLRKHDQDVFNIYYDNYRTNGLY